MKKTIVNSLDEIDDFPSLGSLQEIISNHNDIYETKKQPPGVTLFESLISTGQHQDLFYEIPNQIIN